MTTNDYQSMLRNAVLDEKTFVQLTLQGRVRGPAVPWRKIVVRPVLVKNKRHLQFSWFDAKQDVTKNYRGEEAAARVDEVLAIPYSAIHLSTTENDLQVQLTKKGKVILHRGGAPKEREAPDLAHNRTKTVPLPVERSVDVLQAAGIVNSEGQVKSQMADKYAQINEFLRLFEGTGDLNQFEQPIKIVDCGSGSAYLTLGVYHYLVNLHDMPAEMTGIDQNPHVVQKSNAARDQLQYTGLRFVQSSIEAFTPDVQPDVVLALHACDTATDDAIAGAVRWGARWILCAPCCHHDLNDQITSDLFRPVLRHGILKQRMADILTDSFRALALRIAGYRSEVIEFISADHTAKNLMIRAVKTNDSGDRAAIEEYQALKAFWQVTPYIEKVLGEDFRSLVTA